MAAVVVEEVLGDLEVVLLGRALERVPHDLEVGVAAVAHEPLVKVRHGDEADVRDLVLVRLHRSAAEHGLVVVHVPHLRRDRDSLAVLGALLPKVEQRLVRVGAPPRVHQVRRDHHPRASLASLAVDRRHVALVRREPLSHRVAERLDERERRRVVVVEPKAERALKVLPQIVLALAAQVVHGVVPFVPRLEEPLHLAHRVAVQRLHSLGGVPHRDELLLRLPVRPNVRQVQVEAVLLEALLLLGHQALDRVHFSGSRARGGGWGWVVAASSSAPTRVVRCCCGLLLLRFAFCVLCTLFLRAGRRTIECLRP